MQPFSDMPGSTLLYRTCGWVCPYNYSLKTNNLTCKRCKIKSFNSYDTFLPDLSNTIARGYWVTLVCLRYLCIGCCRASQAIGQTQEVTLYLYQLWRHIHANDAKSGNVLKSVCTQDRAWSKITLSRVLENTQFKIHSYSFLLICNRAGY